MWFVILALLIVAAYFVYDALRDRRFAESGNSMSTAQRISPTGYQGAPGTAGAQAQAFRSDNDSTAASTAAAGVAAAAVVTGAAAVTTGTARRGSSASGGKLQFLDAPIGQKEDLTRIDGIGPIVEEELNNIGIYHYHQIGNFSDSDVDSVNAELDFPGRIEREQWISQARKLMTDVDAVAKVRAGATAVSTTSADVNAADHTVSAPAAATSGIGVSAAAGVGLATAGVAAAAGNGSTVDNNDDWVNINDADLTGAWNTDVLIEIQERLKVLNTRESDAPRLNISREDYRAIKDDDDSRFTRDDLLKILDRLRALNG